MRPRSASLAGTKDTQAAGPPDLTASGGGPPGRPDRHSVSRVLKLFSSASSGLTQSAPATETITLEAALANPLLQCCFRDYLVSVLSEESLSCVLLLQELAQASVPQAKILSEIIVREHLEPSAPHPVNVLAKTRLDALQRYRSWDWDATPSARTMFEALNNELQKLLASDSILRFVGSSYARQYADLLEFCRRHALPAPVALASMAQSCPSNKMWLPVKALTEDVQLWDSKKGTLACGTVRVRCSVQRTMKLLLDVARYPDWVPDVERAEPIRAFGSALTVFRLHLLLGGTEPATLCLGSSKISLVSHFRAKIGWQSFSAKAVAALDADASPSAERLAALLEFGDSDCGFVLDAMPLGTETNVSLVLSYKKSQRKRAAALVQSVLLGMQLALGGSCESKATELDESLLFLKRI